MFDKMSNYIKVASYDKLSNITIELFKIWTEKC